MRGAEPSPPPATIRKPILPSARFRGEQANVMDRCEGAVMPASGKGNLKFPWKALVQRIPQEMEATVFA